MSEYCYQPDPKLPPSLNPLFPLPLPGAGSSALSSSNASSALNKAYFEASPLSTSPYTSSASCKQAYNPPNSCSIDSSFSGTVVAHQPAVGSSVGATNFAQHQQQVLKEPLYSHYHHQHSPAAAGGVHSLVPYPPTSTAVTDNLALNSWQGALGSAALGSAAVAADLFSATNLALSPRANVNPYSAPATNLFPEHLARAANSLYAPSGVRNIPSTTNSALDAAAVAAAAVAAGSVYPNVSNCLTNNSSFARPAGPDLFPQYHHQHSIDLLSPTDGDSLFDPNSSRRGKRSRSPVANGVCASSGREAKICKLESKEVGRSTSSSIGPNVATVKPVSRSVTPIDEVSGGSGTTLNNGRTYFDISQNTAASAGGDSSSADGDTTDAQGVAGKEIGSSYLSSDNLVSHPTINLEQLHSSEDKAVLDADKKKIERHPLFSLLLNLFERLEKCTSYSSPAITPAVSSVNNPVAEEPPWASTLIRSDVEAFNRLKPTRLNSGNEAVDNLVLNAIQVLRIHLFEIEKVHSLCRDFCEKYVQTLKTKINSERLLGPLVDELGFESAPPTSHGIVAGGDPMGTTGDGSTTTLFQMVHTSQGLVPQAVQVSASSIIPTGIGQVPRSSSPLDYGSVGGTLDPKRSKRGVLPKYATQVMKSWLFQHIVHPYPTEDEKRQIAQQTGLTLLQVNNWFVALSFKFSLSHFRFINARRRILQPMLDSNNPELKSKRKSESGSSGGSGSLSSSQKRPFERYWSRDLAKGQLNSPGLRANFPSQSLSPTPTTTNVANSCPTTGSTPQHAADEESLRHRLGGDFDLDDPSLADDPGLGDISDEDSENDQSVVSKSTDHIN